MGIYIRDGHRGVDDESDSACTAATPHKVVDILKTIIIIIIIAAAMLQHRTYIYVYVANNHLSFFVLLLAFYCAFICAIFGIFTVHRTIRATHIACALPFLIIASCCGILI